MRVRVKWNCQSPACSAITTTKLSIKPSTAIPLIAAKAAAMGRDAAMVCLPFPFLLFPALPQVLHVGKDKKCIREPCRPIVAGRGIGYCARRW